jgi:hypothetical protein
MLRQNKFSSAKPACFDFCSSNLFLENHILSTAGDALSQHQSHHLFHTCALNTPYEVCSSQYGVHCAGPSRFCRRAEGLFTLVLPQKIVFKLLVLETKNNPTCSPEMNK